MFKKHIGILIALLLMLTSVPLVGAQASLPADLDGDRSVGLSDATKLFFSVSGTIALTPRETALADLNHSGKIELDEATSAFFLVNGLEVSVPEAIDFTVFYRDIASKAPCADSSDILVFDTSSAWHTYMSTFDSVERAQYIGLCQFDTHSLLLIPMNAYDRYIANVTADDEHLYVSCVTVNSPTAAVSERTAFAFVTVSKADLNGRELQLIDYIDEDGVYADPDETILNHYNSLSYASVSACNGEHYRPMVFQSVSDCDTFIDNHTPPSDHVNSAAIRQLLTNELAAYDEAFFETHVLVRIPQNAPSSGYSITDTTYCATEDALLITCSKQVPMDDDVVLLALSESVAYIPVPREHYHHQEITLIERNRSRHVPYSTVYKASEAPAEDVVEGSAVLIRSMQELEAAYAAEPVGTPDYTTALTDAAFENTVYILVDTYAPTPPTDIRISRIVYNHSYLDVSVRYFFDHEWGAADSDTISFGRMLVAVPAETAASCTSVKLREYGVYTNRTVTF